MIQKGVGLLAVGLFLLWLGIAGWRHRREERISLIEAAILKAGNAEPLPFNRWDRAMAYVFPILSIIFGLFWVFLGLVVLFA